MLSITNAAAVSFTQASPALMGSSRLGFSVQMLEAGNSKLPVSYAPAGMGSEFVSQPRKALKDYVGASEELALFPGGEVKPWDPLSLSKLYTVSGNNPDAAWLREAELKHGRMAMLAFAGVVVTNSGLHLPGPDGLFADSDWTTAWSSVNAKNPAVTGAILGLIAGCEGYNSEGLFDLWFGDTSKRTPGDNGFDPLGLMPKGEAAANKMRLKELKNGRIAMIAMAGLATNHFSPGAVPFAEGHFP